MKKNKSKKRPILQFLFVAYGLVMLWLLFGRPQAWDPSLTYKQMLVHNTNLIPLLTIKNYWYVIVSQSNSALVRHCIINLAGNVFLFIPIGFWLVRFWPYLRNFFLFLATCTGIILLIETVQLFTLLGSFDIDDVILNLAGMLIGYFFCLIVCRKK